MLVRNRYFYAGLAGLLLLGVVTLLLFDRVVMPGVTRHDAGVQVPSVMYRHVDDAVRILEAQGLQVDRMAGRFRAEFEDSVITDQFPPASSVVKPGRRITITVNSGTVPTVRVPDVSTYPIRQARTEMLTAGLRVAAERPDPIPSPHSNTVTRTDPPGGAVVDKGTEVVLWYSTGLGRDMVTVPDVSGMPLAEARRTLIALRLRSVAVGASDPAAEVVIRQSPSEGTRVREGSEVRLFAGVPETPDAPVEGGASAGDDTND